MHFQFPYSTAFQFKFFNNIFLPQLVQHLLHHFKVVISFMYSVLKVRLEGPKCAHRCMYVSIWHILVCIVCICVYVVGMHINCNRNRSNQPYYAW